MFMVTYAFYNCISQFFISPNVNDISYFKDNANCISKNAL